jgi:hypothetical protein
LKTKATRSSETSVLTATKWHITEDGILESSILPKATLHPRYCSPVGDLEMHHLNKYLSCGVSETVGVVFRQTEQRKNEAQKTKTKREKKKIKRKQLYNICSFAAMKIHSAENIDLSTKLHDVTVCKPMKRETNVVLLRNAFCGKRCRMSFML